ILKSGEASFPLIGSVKIAGMTVPDATRIIKERYAKEFLVDPQVTLTVENYAAQHVSVVGAVKSPGQIVYPENGTFDLLSAIGSAGGLLENADKNRISLVRASGGQATYSLSSLQNSGQVPIQPEDRVIVYESAYVKKIVTVLGQVKKPGTVEFPLDGSLDLITGIAMAGGYSDIANPKKVSVSRNGKVSIINAQALAEGGGAPFVLQPGDIVNVAERIF
ncbi:MAG: polysaccharide export protein, partial [Akkermansiaceae bacterium]|nr:polysaccharide export protein [Akkermansiaceae bacterium]